LKVFINNRLLINNEIVSLFKRAQSVVARYLDVKVSDNITSMTPIEPATFPIKSGRSDQLSYPDGELGYYW